MDSLGITTTQPFAWDAIVAALYPRWRVYATPGPHIAVEDVVANSRVYIYPDTERQHDGVFTATVDYANGVELVKQVVVLLFDSPAYLIDNDFGTVLPGDEFVALIKRNPAWNWRQNA